MTSGMRILLSLAALVLIACLPLASSDTPAARPAPAVAAAEPFVPPATATQACPRTDIPSFFFEPKAAVVEACGKCSDTGCLGKGPTSPCGGGRHCVPQSQCPTSSGFFCKCLSS